MSFPDLGSKRKTNKNNFPPGEGSLMEGGKLWASERDDFKAQYMILKRWRVEGGCKGALRAGVVTDKTSMPMFVFTWWGLLYGSRSEPAFMEKALLLLCLFFFLMKTCVVFVSVQCCLLFSKNSKYWTHLFFFCFSSLLIFSVDFSPSLRPPRFWLIPL